MRSCLAFAAILALLPACDGDPPPSPGNLILLVELKTDLVPAIEFAAVRTQLFDPADRTDELTRRQVDVALGRDLTTGLRVAELGDLAVGTYLVRVTLVDLADADVLRRDVVVTVRETAGVTVLMTRDCLGVMCPGTGSDPTETACLGGRCVEERCTPETPEYCPVPECTAATECTDVISDCAAPVCEDGTCFVRSETAMCTPVEEYCDPAMGCTAVPVLGDAGGGDAGDAGTGSPIWMQRAYLKASNASSLDYFGFAVSLSGDGNTLAVGARREDSDATGVDGDQSGTGALFSGAVYVFSRSVGGWVQEAYLKASNTDIEDQFGRFVSLSADGNTLAVTAWNEASAAMGVDGDQGDNSASGAGAVYVFARDAGTWSQEAYLKASNTASGDRFGFGLSLSGDGNSLAVGARREESDATGVDGNESDDSSPGAGAVYVFSRASGSWTQQAYLKASNTGGGDRFGSAVSMSADGDTLAVGAPMETSGATGVGGDEDSNSAAGSGAVYLFTRSAATWSQEAYIKASNTGPRDEFGSSLFLSPDGTTLAVGANLEDSTATGVDGDQSNDGASDAGAVYVFATSGGVWVQQAYLKASNTDPTDEFGVSLSLDADGSTLAVGAYREASAARGVGGDEGDDSAPGGGAVYVFSRTGETWTAESYLKASNTGTDDEFGWSLSLSADGTTLAVAAQGEASAGRGVDADQTDNAASGAGAVYTFTR